MLECIVTFKYSSFQVEQANNSIYHVKDGVKTFTVNMDEMTCIDIKFQMDDMPCTHAMAAIKKAYMDLYEYCSRCYKKKDIRRYN